MNKIMYIIIDITIENIKYLRNYKFSVGERI